MLRSALGNVEQLITEIIDITLGQVAHFLLLDRRGRGAGRVPAGSATARPRRAGTSSTNHAGRARFATPPSGRSSFFLFPSEVRCPVLPGRCGLAVSDFAVVVL